MSAAGMLAAARRTLGMSGRPNLITRVYASRHGKEFLVAPWCDMAVTYWARASGNEDAVLPEGDRAYTVWHAQDGQRAGRWHPGTTAAIRAHAAPGAIVFFDWGATDNVGAIDHVGLVERNLGDGRVQTIEGNTGDVCARRVRAANVIAGFWNPAYDEEEDDMTVDALYKAAWEQDRMPVPYGTAENPAWKPRSVLVDHGVQLRRILATLEVQNATIGKLVEALGQRDEEIDVTALVGAIRAEISTAIEGISVRLDVGGS